MSTLIDAPLSKSRREKIEQAVIRFAGGFPATGMQITGSQFTNTVAAVW